KNSIRELLPVVRKLKEISDNYLGEEKKYISKDTESKIRREILTEEEEILSSLFTTIPKEDTISYDKYKKSFIFENNKISPGEIVSSQRLGVNFSLQKSILETGEGKRLAKILREKKITSIITEKYSKDLAKNLKEEFKSKDLLKSKAYKEINERIGKRQEQFGVQAEQIFIGLLESLSLDREDLAFKVYEANPWQDVENKIDFILERKNKKRGIGVEESEKEELKTIGVQFTTALSKREHKLDQIQKAKNKIKDIDDIVYVEIDSMVLRKAISEAEKTNNKFINPVKFLPEKIKNQLLKNLFTGILNEKEIESLNKNV
ncbi:MAG: hypothetical protein PHQ01_04465, partial [Candidatus Pacebacteria bacterium]|nr:hypothetical protein [Candidatus Paceibacterota bacterium]